MKLWVDRPPCHLPAEDLYHVPTLLVSVKCGIQNNAETNLRQKCRMVLRFSTSITCSSDWEPLTCSILPAIWKWVVNWITKIKVSQPKSSTASVNIWIQSQALCWEESLNFTMAKCALAVMGCSGSFKPNSWAILLWIDVEQDICRRFNHAVQVILIRHNVKLSNNGENSCQSHSHPLQNRF